MHISSILQDNLHSTLNVAFYSSKAQLRHALYNFLVASLDG